LVGLRYTYWSSLFLKEENELVKSLFLKILGSVIAALAVIFVYAFLHEGGHALAAVLAGARVTAFDLNFITGSPHVSWQGIVSPAWRAFIAISGPLLPYIVWLISLISLRKHKSTTTRTGLLVVSVVTISSLLPQVVIPVLFMRGVDLWGEDIVGFISYSRFHPLAVATTFAVVVGMSIWLAVKLLRPLELISARMAFRSTGPISTRQRLLTVAVVLVIILGALPIMTRLTSGNRPRYPKEYDARVQTGFSNFARDWTTIYEFEVEETRVYDMVYSLHTSAPTTLRLVTDSPQGMVFTGKNYMVLCEDAASVSFAQFMGYALLPGNYRLEVETTDRAGSIELYVSSKDVTPEYAKFLTILDALNEGTFTATTYQEEGYELVYQGLLAECEDKLLYALDTAQRPLQVSAFVSGPYEDLTVTYVDGDDRQPILSNSRATTGFGINPRAAQGKLMLTSSAATGEVYIYVKR